MKLRTALILVVGAFLGACMISTQVHARELESRIFTAQGGVSILDTYAMRLGRHAQPDGPVAVMRVPLLAQGLLGSCERAGPGYLIEIASEITDPELQVEVLIHEWAHARAWHRLFPWSDDHGREWGEEYSETYRAALDLRDAEWTPLDHL
jgi:hypothetical protein